MRRESSEGQRLLTEIHGLWQSLTQLGGLDARRGPAHRQQVDDLIAVIADRSQQYRSLTERTTTTTPSRAAEDASRRVEDRISA